MNTLLLNGVLAIIKNAPELAREYFREAKVESASAIYIAIIKEVEKSNRKAKIDSLRSILNKSLKIKLEDERFTAGVAAIEKIIEEEIAETKAGEDS